MAFHSFWVWVDFFLASIAREGREIPEREGALLCQVSDLPPFWLWAFLWWNSLKWDPTEVIQRGLTLHPPTLYNPFSWSPESPSIVAYSIGCQWDTPGPHSSG